MAEIWTRATRQRQPQGAVAVDWGNPVSRNLEVCFSAPSPSRNLVNQSPFTVSGARQIANARGLGVGFSGGLGAVRFADNRSITYGSECSVVWVAATAAVSNRVVVGDRTPVTGLLRLFIVVVTSGAVKAQSTTGSAADTTLVTTNAGFVDGVPHVFAFVKRGSSVHEFYKDGILFASTTSVSGSLNNNAGSVFEIGGINTGISGFDHAEPINLLALYPSRALLASEIAALSANPWQLFAPERRVSYFFPASGIPTLSAATAVSIGSTTATPRVTLTF